MAAIALSRPHKQTELTLRKTRQKTVHASPNERRGNERVNHRCFGFSLFSKFLRSGQSRTVKDPTVSGEKDAQKCTGRCREALPCGWPAIRVSRVHQSFEGDKIISEPNDRVHVGGRFDLRPALRREERHEVLVLLT